MAKLLALNFSNLLVFFVEVLTHNWCNILAKSSLLQGLYKLLPSLCFPLLVPTRWVGLPGPAEFLRFLLNKATQEKNTSLHKKCDFLNYILFSHRCALVVKLCTCSAAGNVINWLCVAWGLPVHPPRDLSWRSSRWSNKTNTNQVFFLICSLNGDSPCLSSWLPAGSVIIPS